MLIFVTFGVAAVRTSIRQVDFKNFSYPWSGPSGWPDHLEWQRGSERQDVQLVKGRWRLDRGRGKDDPRFSGLTLETVEFADVTDDGKEDAIVVLRFDTGGTQYSHYVYLYSFGAGKPKLLAYFHSGDRAYSGLYRVYGEGGKLVVELFDPEKRSGDCCSSGFVRTRYRWHNGRFEAFGGREFGTPTARSRLPVTLFGTHM
jgi:predicted dehydrogenase